MPAVTRNKEMYGTRDESSQLIIKMNADSIPNRHRQFFAAHFFLCTGLVNLKGKSSGKSLGKSSQGPYYDFPTKSLVHLLMHLLIYSHPL